MVRDTVSHLRAEGQQVFLDAEHFFDGYRANRAYALRGAAHGVRRRRRGRRAVRHQRRMLPSWISDVVHDVVSSTGGRVGIHAHNDSGCAVANSLAAVDAGATHVQGCINGYGERTGNADLVTVVANLEPEAGPQGAACRALLRDSTRIAHAVAEVTNVPPASRQPYVGTVGVRPQGGPARQRDQGRPVPLPAPRPAGRRQRHAAAGLRHGRPRVDRAEGPRARLRPQRRQGAGRPDHRPGQGAGVARLHLRGGRRVLRAAARRGGRGRAAVVLRGRVVAGDHRDAEQRRARGRRRSPRPP